MCLLKKYTLFIWDEWVWESFDSLKKSLVSTPLLNPQEYSRDFLLYIFASKGTIGMVVVQEYDELHEDIIYYLIWNWIGHKLKYSHVEKITLANIHVVQRLRHYILLCKTIMVANINPFQYILTSHMIGGE
jgi:hypothetical protein